MQSDIEALEKAVEWLDGLGLGNQSDRLHKYLDSIRHQLPLPVRAQEAAQMGFVFLEAREFIDIHKAYKGAETATLKAKLKIVLRGPWTLLEESINNGAARNTMFELSVAAGLKLRGVDVEIGEPDVVINFPKGQYLVECKRPFRESSVKQNVRDAKNQLKAHLKPDQHGVIAVSLSRIVNPGSTMLGVTVGDQNTAGTVHGTLRADLHRRCSSIMLDQLSTLSFSPNIVALMFDVATPYITEKGEGLARGCRIYPTDEPRVIRRRVPARRNISSAFMHFERTIGQVLENDLSPEAHAVSDLIDMKSQLPPGVGMAISKDRADPSPIEVIFGMNYKDQR